MKEDIYIPIYKPGDNQEVMWIHSILEGSGIRYYINNENLHGIIGGGDLLCLPYTHMELRVEASQKDKALELLQRLIGK